MKSEYTNEDDYDDVPSSIPDADHSSWPSSCVSSADSDESLSISSPLLSPTLCESLWKAPTQEPDAQTMLPVIFDDSLTSLPFQDPLMGELPLIEDESTLQFLAA